MTTHDIITITASAVILPLYIYYLIQKRKEQAEQQDTKLDKVIEFIKEIAKDNPKYTNIAHKIGMF